MSHFVTPAAHHRASATRLIQHIAEAVYTPKMPGEPMRVQPSRAKARDGEDA